jgi:hypothetical protein
MIDRRSRGAEQRAASREVLVRLKALAKAAGERRTEDGISLREPVPSDRKNGAPL